jgi:uncharacterized protein YlxW (UPF0749 family)
MPSRKWTSQILVTVICAGLGILLVLQFRTERVTQQSVNGEGWEFIIADLVDSNARLGDEIEALEAQLTEFEDVGTGGAVLESLVDQVNRLRMANGLVEVSGPGVDVSISGPIGVLDLHDLINELRNAGAEALALNNERIVVWSAISTDGEVVTVDGRPVPGPYHVRAIGEPNTLETALVRPGGLIELLQRANRNVTIAVTQSEKLTLPVYAQPFEFAYSKPIE